MKLKDGADITGVQWQMFYAALVAEQIFNKYGTECVITAGVDGKHMQGSLHYVGKALDLRTFMVPGREMAIKTQLQQALGKDYDVVIEKDHLHVEFQPKGV